MALADIINRIESDAAAEAAAIVEAAEKRAAEIEQAAEEDAAARTASAVATAEQEAAREASRIVAAAKLAARDEALAARRAVIDEALQATVEKLAQLPVDAYAEFLAPRIAAVARGGEVLRFGTADDDAAGAVVEAVTRVAPQLTLTISPDPAPFERGALVEGDRVKADLSLEAIVQERRDQLELALADVVFGKEG